MDIYEYLNITPQDYTFKRDYIMNPLKKNVIRVGGGKEYEKADDEDLKYLYINLNLTVKEMNTVIGHKISDYLSKFNKKEIKSHPRVTKEELEHRLYVDNVPMSQLYKEYGFKSTGGLISWCNKLGIHIRSPRWVKNKFNRDELLEDYMSGMMFGEMVKKYNTTDKTIQKVLKDFNISTNEDIKNSRGYKKQIDKRKDISVLLDKQKFLSYISDYNIKTTKELKNSIGITQSTINIYLRKMGLSGIFDKAKSYPEHEIKDMYGDLLVISNKSLIKPQEIDLYCESKKIGIEFNGNYWHSEKNKDLNYHQQKSKLASDKGIFLYHIFEYEWENKREQIINQLNNLLGLNQTKIHARKCIIKEVDAPSKNDFLELNHLQGKDSSSVKLGLYYNNELVSLMTFCKPRFNKNFQWELSRFCSKAGCNVIGGASKLFKYFINEYKPTNVISYSDIAKTRGTLYDKLGFELTNISNPNYVWIKNHDVKTRYQCQKHKLLAQGFIGDSETDIMYNRGYYKIFDCGNFVWSWENR